DVDANVVSVDPNDNEMTMRLSFVPHGSFRSPVGTLSAPMDLIINGTVDKGTIKFGAGEFMDPIDITLALDGRVTRYQFDSYNVVFDVFFVRPNDVSNGQELFVAPTRLATRAAVHGFDLRVRDVSARFHEPDFNFIRIRVERAASTLFFAVFIMVLMWALAIAGIAIATILTLVRHDIGPGVLGFLAALLFALPGIRQVLPGAPPLGALNDYLAFFWAEAIIAVTLSVLAVIFLRRELATWRRERAGSLRTEGDPRDTATR